jgi:hypothetical protein
VTDRTAARVAQLQTLLAGALTAQAICAFAQLGVADELGDDPRSAEDLAAAIGAHAGSLDRLLRALTSVGLVAERRPGWYGRTELSDVLRDDDPNGQADYARFAGTAIHTALGALATGVRSGTPAYEIAHGSPFYDHLAASPDVDAVWIRAMAGTGRHLFEAEATLAAYPWRGDEIVVDVGGGPGSLLRSLLAMHPRMRGVLVDLPPVVEAAQKALAESGVADRCDFVSGSFFEALPGGGDVYVVARVLFNWDDTEALRILERCRTAMAPSARVAIVEWLVPDDSRPHPSKVHDLAPLLMGGRTRTLPELATLLRAAGFGDPVVHERPRGLQVVVAAPEGAA